MRHFGSKQELFDRIAEPSQDAPAGAPSGPIEDLLLDSLRGKLSADNARTLALLRSMLTHPHAADGVRDSLSAQQRQVAEVIIGSHAMTRAALVGMITLAAVLGRDLLRLDGLRDADPDTIVELLCPAVRILVSAESENDQGVPAG